MRDFEHVFTGFRCLPGEYHIEIDPNIRPVQHTPRRVPVPLKTKLKEKIDEMEKEGIIIQETKLTDSISSLVAVQKPGKLSAETGKVKSMHRPPRFKSRYQEAKVPSAYS